MKIKAILFCSIILLNSCAALKELSTFSKCQFRIDKLTQPEIAGVRIDNKNSFSDLSIVDAGKVTASLLTGRLPLTFNLNVQAKNPNPTLAAMNKMDWIAMLDGVEVLRGSSNDRVEIAANGGTTMIPLKISVDLKEVLSGKSKDALLNLAFNLADPQGNPSRVKLKIKPTIMLGNVPVQYPGYITLSKQFKAQ